MKNWLYTAARAIVVCALCVAVTPAQISTTGPAALARQMPTIYAPYLANISRVRVLKKRGQLKSSQGSIPSRQGGQKTPSPASPAQDTVFQTSQPPFVPQQLAARLARTQQDRQYIENVLTRCLTFYTDTAKQKGVPLNDVALALNYFISTNYFVYSVGRGPTPAQMSATRDSIRANMVQDDAFRQMSDKQKQEAYETLIVLAGFVDMGYGTSKKSGDEGAAEQFRQMAKYNLETVLGVSIDKIHFTDNGLELS